MQFYANLSKNSIFLPKHYDKTEGECLIIFENNVIKHENMRFYPQKINLNQATKMMYFLAAL